MTSRCGFTLIELLVVTAISVLLMTIGSAVYVKCLNVYEEGQGVTQVYETARLIERDLRDFLGQAAPVKGNWITPACYRFPGGNIANQRLYSYSTFGYYGHLQNYSNAADPAQDYTFSGSQFSYSTYDNWNHIGSSRGNSSYGPQNWGLLGMALWTTNNNIHNAAWWAPGFFGQRNGATKTVLEKYNNEVGSWGFPRPDYRLDADADDLTNHNNVACWFYCEDRDFNSLLTLALDNPNLMLASIKFSRWESGGHEFTQLSMLKHHLSGFDQPGRQGARVRADYGYGNMVRAIRIQPYYLAAGGDLTEMGDTELGCDLTGKTVAGGQELPRCFDVRLVLQNPYSYQRHSFGYRFYNVNQPK